MTGINHCWLWCIDSLVFHLDNSETHTLHWPLCYISIYTSSRHQLTKKTAIPSWHLGQLVSPFNFPIRNVSAATSVRLAELLLFDSQNPEKTSQKAMTPIVQRWRSRLTTKSFLTSTSSWKVMPAWHWTMSQFIMTWLRSSSYTQLSNCPLPFSKQRNILLVLLLQEVGHQSQKITFFH